MTVRQTPSVAEGAACGLGDLEGRPLVRAIADRVARAPEGRFWSLRQPGCPRSRTYGELWARSARIAAGLAARVPLPGSPVVLMLEDGLDFIPAFWACLRAGLVPVPLARAAAGSRPGDPSLPPDAALVALAPRLAVADEATLPAPGEALPCACVTPAELDGHAVLTEDASPAEPACVLATSGSTGTVKLIALSGRAMLHRAFTTCHPALSDSGAAIHTLPLDSTSGIACAILGSRECIHLPMSTLARGPTCLFDAVETFRASSFSVTDTMAGRIVGAVKGGDRWDLSSLRQVGLGAEAVLPSTVRHLDGMLQRFGAPAGIVRAGYGTTETGTLLTGADPLASGLVGGLGVPLGGPAPNVAIRIVDGAGAVVPEGTVGEVEVHAPLKTFSFYWGDREATARGFTADGWWRTGDAGLLWGGQIALRGRTRDVFIFNGRKHALSVIDDAMRDGLGPGEAAFACTVAGGTEGAEALGVALVTVPARRVAAEASVRQAIGRAFGLPVAVIGPVPASAVPLTPTGKVKRAELAALLSASEPPTDGDAGGRPVVSAPTGSVVAQVWEAVLGPGSAMDPHAGFFALGGDSLQAADLLARIAKQAGVVVDPGQFLADPSLSTLLRLFGAAPPVEARRTAADVWPLTSDQYGKQIVFLHAWSGERPTANGLVLGFNTAGRKPPLVLVCQESHEVADLALHLGPDQPVFGLRSGSHIIEHGDEEVQAFALRYTADVQGLLPEGPVFLAGVCQGGLIALAMAQHLLRRRRHVPLLVLMEWPALLQPYPGRVLFLVAEASDLAGPYREFREPERAWRRHHAEVEVVAVPGDHLDYLKPDNVPRTAAILAERFAEALRRPALHLADEHRRAEISLGPVPPRVEAGRSFTVEVAVTNASATPWSETERSGLMLGCRWISAAGESVEPHCGRSPLPAMVPNVPTSVRLTVTAPATAGRASLIVDVVEEGNTWFGARSARRPTRAIVDVRAAGGFEGLAGGADRTTGRHDAPDSPSSHLTDTHRIEPSSILQGEGLSWRVVLPPRFRPGDTVTDHGASALDLWEDDRPIGPAHTPHDEIRTWGGGAYSHWNDTLYLSTTDGTDPRTSGRVYSFQAPVGVGTGPH